MNGEKPIKRFDLEGLAMQAALKSVILDWESNRATVDDGTANGIQYQGLPNAAQRRAILEGTICSAQLVYSGNGYLDVKVDIRYHQFHQQKSKLLGRLDVSTALMFSERDSRLVQEIADYISTTCLKHGVGAAFREEEAKKEYSPKSPE